MSRKTVDNVRNGKPFRLLDLIVYGGLALAIIALFMAFVFFRPHSAIGKIFVDVRGERVVTYDFDTKALTVADGKAENVEVTKADGKTTLKIFVDDEHTEYNVIEIDDEKQSVSVTDANCSRHKDCVYSPAITSADGMIMCVPHELKVYGKSDNMNPSLG